MELDAQRWTLSPGRGRRGLSPRPSSAPLVAVASSGRSCAFRPCVLKLFNAPLGPLNPLTAQREMMKHSERNKSHLLSLVNDWILPTERAGKPRGNGLAPE